MIQLEKGRPEDSSTRLEKEIRTYDLLDFLQIPYERVDHEAAMTMEACRQIDELLFPAFICKNLFLSDSKARHFYLLAMRGDKKFITREISSQIGSSRLQFASADDMERLLDITPGSVSVLGLMNDHEHQVQLLVDQDLLDSELFACHPCINTSSIRLQTTDLLQKFLPAINHDYITVEISKTPQRS